MVNKKIGIGIIAVMLVAILGMSGCTETPKSSLETNAGVANVVVGETHFFEQKFTEQNQKKLITANPPPKLTKSLERENLISRYTLLNDESKIFYIYFISYGKVMAYYTAQGKVSSINSRLTQEEQLIRAPRIVGGERIYHPVGSPQLDGSYGTNGDGIFFFTTEGAYVEWNGEYIVSDFPLKITTPVALTREVK